MDEWRRLCRGGWWEPPTDGPRVGERRPLSRRQREKREARRKMAAKSRAQNRR